MSHTFEFLCSVYLKVWKGLKAMTKYRTPPLSTEVNQPLYEDLNEDAADDSTLIGLIQDGDESAYRQEV